MGPKPCFFFWQSRRATQTEFASTCLTRRRPMERARTARAGHCSWLSVTQKHSKVRLLQGTGRVKLRPWFGGTALPLNYFLVMAHLQALAWIQGAKRIGVPFVAVAAGTSSYALGERIRDIGPTVLVTSGNLLPIAREARSAHPRSPLYRPTPI